jgi:hypothetical protein
MGFGALPFASREAIIRFAGSAGNSTAMIQLKK